MAENNHEPPGVTGLLGKVGRTALGALQNRGELLVLELQEEKARLLELLVWAAGLLFLGIMAAVSFTAMVIFFFPLEYWRYVAAGFTVLYLAAAVFAFFFIRNLLKRPPLPETMAQVRKDRIWVESLE